MNVGKLKQLLQSKADHWAVLVELSLNGEKTYVELESSAVKIMQERKDGKAIYEVGLAPEGLDLQNAVVVCVEVEVSDEVPGSSAGEPATLPTTDSTTDAAPRPTEP